MELSRFKKLHKEFSKFPISIKKQNTLEFIAYQNAYLDNKECHEWVMKLAIKNAAIDYRKYCCLEIAYHLIQDKRTRKINYDSIITHKSTSKDYGIPIHDGGNSYIKISYCPWCGTSL